MEAYFALLIPIILSIVCFIIFKEKLVWYEVLLPIFIGFILIIGIKNLMISSNTQDTQYLSTYATSVSYEEPWNEYIHQTCTRTYACGTTTTTHANGNTSSQTQYCTETYDCSYVEEHGPRWYVKCANGDVYNVSEQKYNQLKSEWKNSTFIEMNRHYHTRDGDKYTSDWNKDINSMLTCNWTETYENKVQASHSVYNFNDIDEKEVIKNKLFSYPNIGYYSYDLNSILSQKAIFPKEYKAINNINGLLGAKKKFHLWLLIFENDDRTVADLQQSYWKGGNKNELVVCVGVDKIRRIKWVNVFTWSDKHIVRIKVRNYLNDKKGQFFDILEFKDFLFPLVNDEWVMKDWHDFDFLSVELTDNQLIWLYILVLISTIICLIIAVLNDRHSEHFVRSTRLNLVVKRRYKSLMDWIRYRMGTDPDKF